MELDLQYQEAAKPLYNLALFTVGDWRLAEEAALGAMTVSYRHLPDKSDQDSFRSECLRHLYRYGKKICRQNRELSEPSANSESGTLPPAAGNKRLDVLLEGLSYDEKYILLLFCCHKLTVSEIAKTLGMPEVLVEKLLKKAAAKAG